MIESFSQIPNDGKIKTYDKIKIPEAFSQTYFSIEAGIGFIRVTNASDKKFTTTMSMKEMTGIKAIKPKSLPYRFDMGAGCTDIIGFFVSH